VSGQQSPQIGKRASGRVRLFLPARLVCGRNVRRVMLCDLSLEGAMIMAPDLLAEDYVSLRWCGFEARGSISWSDGQTGGIHFDEQLSWDTVLSTRGEQDERGYSARAAELYVAGGSGPVINI